MRLLSLGPQIVWSDGATSLNHPMMAGASTADFVQARFHIEMRNRTGGAKVRVVAQSSDDGVNWTDPWVVLVAGYTNTNGITFGTTWVTIQTAYTGASQTLRAFIRLGVEAGGVTAGVNELSVISLRADVKGQ